jgi:ribosomal protein S18 acetylase RimI-like enzyme
LEVTSGLDKGGFYIRRVVAEDYDALLAVWQAAGSDVEPSRRESREAFARQLAMFADLHLVAVEGERIVGVVLGSHDGRKGWINRLAVDPAYQRRGIGAMLVTAVDTAIRGHGITIVCALVELDNAASASLFRQLGYADNVPVIYFRKPDPD